MRRSIPLLALVALTSCGEDPRTQVMVFVRAEGMVQERAARLEVDVLGGAPGEARALRDTVTYTDSTDDEFFPLEWPRRIALVPEGGDATRTFAIVARALDDAGDELASAEIASSYLEGETLTLDVWLRDSCIDQSCGDGQTCVDGACSDVPEADPCSLTRLEDGTAPEGCEPMDAGTEEDAGPGMDADVDGGVDAGDDDAGPGDAGPPEVDAGPGPLDIYNVVFVTSSTHRVGGLGNLPNADEICRSRAAEAGLPSANYVAFLSLSSASAVSRLTGSRGWVRTDGLPVIDEPADLMAGEMFYPIALTEMGGQPTVTTVATGTSHDLSPGETCDDYTNLGGNVTAGNAYDGTRYFTDRIFGFAPFEPAVACDELAAIYCFGTGRDVELTPPPPQAGAGGAHVSSAMPAVGPMGIADFDAACGAGYVAFLPDGASAALDRLGGFGGPWVRPDGVVVAENITQLASERLLAPPLQTAIGVYLDDARVWSTEMAPDSPGGFTCSDWTNTSGGMARFSYLGRSRSFYSRAVSRACGPQGERVICLSTGAVH